MKSFIIMLILVLTYSVKEKLSVSEIADIERPDKLLVINYENILKNKKMVCLSQVASNVRYIQLETNPSCLINHHFKVKFFLTDSLIFVQNVNHVLKFSLNGKFIKKIGNPGRGPGEIGIINSMSVLPNKKMLVIHYHTKLLFYSFDGNLIRSINIPYHQEVKAINDSRYIAYDPSTNGSEKYNFILANDKGDTISTVKNYTTWEKSYSGTVIVTSPANEAFYMKANSWCFKSKYNDTVYYVDAVKDKIESAYIIDYGKYKVPEKLIPEKVVSDPIKFQNFKERAVNYFYGKPLEASNKVFITSTCMGKFDIKYFIYDKIDNVGTLLVNEDGLESKGILNDWDGGVDFWPITQKNDKEIAMVIEVLEFKNKLESKDLNNRIIKYPNQQKALKNLISDLDVLDNPIIMVVTLKNKF
jgi:hypothetical protein